MTSKALLFLLIAAFTTWFIRIGIPKTLIVCSPTNRIYTVASPPRVECLSIRGDRIISVGSWDEVSQVSHSQSTSTRLSAQLSVRFPSLVEVANLYTPSAIANAFERALNLLQPPPEIQRLHPDHALYPGFTDAHAHVIENGYMLQLPLSETKSMEEVIKTLEAYILDHPELLNDTDKWIEGMGWDQTKWNEGKGADLPNADDLNESPILRGRPISLSRIDGHARWVSPRVLDIMEESGKLPPPSEDDRIEKEGGKILRGEDGITPTGIFMDKAMNLIPAPQWTEEQIQAYFDTTIQLALKYGLTSIHDADTNSQFIAFYRKLADAGKLPLRMYLMGYSPSTTYWGNDTASFPHLSDYGKHGRLNLRAVKLYTDGALGSWGAALIEPYSDNAGSTGIMQTQPEELKELVTKFWENGWQTNIHCIGDRANKVVLDIFEELLALPASEDGTAARKYDVRTIRPRIEHAQIFQKSDLGERIGRLGVIASVQPTHSTSDMWYAETRLGPDRIKNAYAYQTLLQASPNHILPLGSDFPVEGVNPLLGFYAAVSRLSEHSGTSPHGEGGWYPSEKLTRAQALKGMTYDPAYASFTEDDLGSLQVGKKADFVILDRDIMDEEKPYKDILDAQVMQTVVDGRVAYELL